MLTAFAGQPDQLAGMPTLLAAADLLEEAASVVIVGSGEPTLARRSRRLAQAALRAPDPAVVVLRAGDTQVHCRQVIRRSARRRGRTKQLPMSAGGPCAACRSPIRRHCRKHCARAFDRRFAPSVLVPRLMFSDPL